MITPNKIAGVVAGRTPEFIEVGEARWGRMLLMGPLPRSNEGRAFKEIL
jgi:hypothetical protein